LAEDGLSANDPTATFAVLQSQIMAHNQPRSHNPALLARPSGGG
jgi:hypothetical protein